MVEIVYIVANSRWFTVADVILSVMSAIMPSTFDIKKTVFDSAEVTPEVAYIVL